MLIFIPSMETVDRSSNIFNLKPFEAADFNFCDFEIGKRAIVLYR